MEVMRFYGWTWFELMQCPIYAFWVCYRQMIRIQAQEALRQLELIAQPNVDESAREKFVTRQVEAMGDVVVARPHVERDADAAEKLKRLSGT